MTYLLTNCCSCPTACIRVSLTGAPLCCCAAVPPNGRQTPSVGIRWKNQCLYSETGFHFGMDCNFVCLRRRHNCRSQVIDLALSALRLLIYEINYWVFKQF
jgi:hypothetical protein